MSCDSGISLSPESLKTEQSFSSEKDGEIPKSSIRTEVSTQEGHHSSLEIESTEEGATPVETKRGRSPVDSEVPLSDSTQTVEPPPRRRRGRPKGAKNKNPKPKPPPKPKRPKGRPRKNSNVPVKLLTHIPRTRQHAFVKIEPVSDKPPDDIFEDCG